MPLRSSRNGGTITYGPILVVVPNVKSCNRVIIQNVPADNQYISKTSSATEFEDTSSAEHGFAISILCSGKMHLSGLPRIISSPGLGYSDSVIGML